MKLFLLILSLFASSIVIGQYKGPKFPINDEWFWKYGSKGLQEGDKMPDMPLGIVMNNKTGKKRFGDFKGKLVILDFWSTGCLSCMRKFPEMEQLQKELGDQIQVLLVNTMETEERIRQFMKNSEGVFKLPDLPVIVSSRSYANLDEYFSNLPLIGKYFPFTSVPHHAWIDKKGSIIFRGGAENTYASKIRALLAGKPITFLENTATVPNLHMDKKARYYKQLGYLEKIPVTYGSFITPYNNEITGAYGNMLREVVDSVSNTIISTAINENLLDLYLSCFNKEPSVIEKNNKLLYSPTANAILDFIEFPKGTDTLDLTSHPGFVQRAHLTTEEIVRSKYCYEQVMPLAVPRYDRYQMMLEDLNRYFKVHYGLTGMVHNRNTVYYELIRTSDQDKVGKTGTSRNPTQIILEAGKPVFEFQGRLIDSLSSLFQDENVRRAIKATLDLSQWNILVLNETKWPMNKQVFLKIPLEGLETVNDLRRALNAYDLDLVQRNGKLPFYVFSRVDKEPQ